MHSTLHHLIQSSLHHTINEWVIRSNPPPPPPRFANTWPRWRRPVGGAGQDVASQWNLEVSIQWHVDDDDGSHCVIIDRVRLCRVACDAAGARCQGGDGRSRREIPSQQRLMFDHYFYCVDFDCRLCFAAGCVAGDVVCRSRGQFSNMSDFNQFTFSLSLCLCL
jgi:hypothetical protein